jgi:ribonuclease HII
MTGVAGVDEAGRGPVMGPLVVAGVLVSEESDLAGLGVKDSKLLAPSQREALVPEIHRVGRVETVSVPAADVDATRTEMTLNVLEVKLFATVLERLAPSRAYVDAADVEAERFARDIASQLEAPPEIVSQHQADAKYPVVSAASIIAKVERDAAVRRIEDDIGRPIGSGYPSGLLRDRAQSRVNEYGAG